MKQKQIGVILVIMGILLCGLLYTMKVQEDKYIRSVMLLNEGSCFLDDGTCLHADRNFLTYVLGGIISASLIMLGGYLILFDKTQKVLEENQLKISAALKVAKEVQSESQKFDAFLGGFEDDQQKVLKAIHGQDGIKQSTLRYRTGMSKTTLSLMLKEFEERKIISRKPAGKTKQIFLQKRF